MNTGQAVLSLGPVRGVAEVRIAACNQVFATIEFGGTQRSISLANLNISFGRRNHRLQLEERYE